MPQPLAHLYDLALRALDDQQRQADAIRGRLGPMLAAAALEATLLSGPLLGAAHPTGAAGALAVAIMLSGLAATIAGAFRVLRDRHGIAFDLDPRELARTLDRDGSLDDEHRYFTAMLAHLAHISDRNADVLDGLGRAFTAMLWGILVMLCGLAVAGLVG